MPKHKASDPAFSLVVYVKSVYNVTLAIGDMLFAPCLKLGAELKPSMEHASSVVRF